MIRIILQELIYFVADAFIILKYLVFGNHTKLTKQPDGSYKVV